jgi:hypothetical protein
MDIGMLGSFSLDKNEFTKESTYCKVFINNKIQQTSS